ncbi:MAG: cytochrome ubiquinol oxidase subunit I [Pseudomonadota bacterium]|uniref:cytochrome ubiquinol oxidase subunit I n=1 Tax=Gallaecimonas pentaromativorans TaxID=584787 RepID=UPI00067F6368|nr:cytochrome ubiquinol oxidase subunit I [Gallaecimonas pentaromativorans]MED5526876.1 cytochrome ubiquinol oxidase subunit I [Pseudomonadota bacterium]
MDAALLSRIQFAWTVSFHILFPTMTIGLAVLIATWEGLWLKTRNPRYLQLAKFWIKPFAITFGSGVVTGIVLSYEFGTNFSEFSHLVGPVLGPLMTYEVLTAFFLEAGFLGVMLFGWQRVGERLHFFATLIVALGTLLSAFWILAANSWMQTPAGYEFVNGQYVPVDWFKVIFNPSFPLRLVHMLLATFLTASFLVAGISAWYLLKGYDREFAKRGLSMTLWFILVLAPLQAFVGDEHGLVVKEHQPAKLAAMEGIWDKVEKSPGLRLFAIPDEKAETNHLEVEVPYLASIILTHSLDGEVTGLKAFAPKDRPPVTPVFFSFRVMVGLGVLMILVAFWANWRRRGGKLWQDKWLLRLLVCMTPAGLIATIAGWWVVEIGRQPWLVYGLVRTEQVVSNLPAERVALTLALFVVTYLVLLAAFLHFYRKLIRKGPPDMAKLESQLVGMQAPGYALNWVRELKKEGF